jgi:hypothetical protein
VPTAADDNDRVTHKDNYVTQIDRYGKEIHNKHGIHPKLDQRRLQIGSDFIVTFHSDNINRLFVYCDTDHI